jgi:hypothetical protein
MPWLYIKFAATFHIMTNDNKLYTVVMLDMVHSLKQVYLIQDDAREITHLQVGIIVYLQRAEILFYQHWRSIWQTGL